MKDMIWLLAIFLSRVCDMSLATFRTILLVRGKKFLAAVIGFFEVLIFVVVLSKVMNSLDSPLPILAYCLGFAFGNYVGGWLEGKAALGNVLVQVISKTETDKMITMARERGLGVTVIPAEGLSGPKKVINVHAKRKWLDKMLNEIGRIDPSAYVSIYDSRQTVGGFFAASKGKKS
ncbi:hypothetical protein CGZ90_00210 [Fictibacillus aquaticus]|uniref:UPF0316 protein CGZ90_00210 n=2 Tax=Fictibacillus aquaticus TaxID=2021314 RepID=A0A235FBH5_9BACL|nr:hypothetical protein CGZ90_00210 [Fictibacillus aquaticus]